MNIYIKNKNDLQAAAIKLLELSEGRRIFAFYGSLGAGKTTIIKALCSHLGAGDMTSSPTFTLVNEYRTDNGNLLYHIDFYRIKNTEEVFDFGLEEYLYGESYCFMEWPEMIEDLLPDGTVKVRIRVGKNENRTLEISLT
jgi:tRNA threonylcarbamoyladenosine biosynthesis protein TsaE